MHEHILGTFEVWLEDVASSSSAAGPVEREASIDMPLLGLLRRNPFLLRDNLRLDNVELAIAESRHSRTLAAAAWSTRLASGSGPILPGLPGWPSGLGCTLSRARALPGRRVGPVGPRAER
jgi:hypothetical protein